MFSHRTQSALIPFFLFVAWLLLLLVSLSIPIIKTISIFSIAANVSSSLLKSGVHASFTFGLWGYCQSGVSATILGINEGSQSSCSALHARYQFNNDLLKALHIQTEVDIVSTGLAIVFSLTPIACALAFIAFIASIFVARQYHGRWIYMVVSLASGVAAFLTTVLFAFDASKIKATEALVKSTTDGDLVINFGSGMWLMLVALILLWISSFVSCYSCFTLRSRHMKGSHVENGHDVKY